MDNFISFKSKLSDNKHYKISVEHSPIGSGLETGLMLALEMDQMKHSAVLIYRFDDEAKAIQLNVNAHKKMAFVFMVS